MKVRTFIPLLTLLVFFWGSAQAQPGWKWPDDEKMAEKAKEKNALYSDALKADNYRLSANHLSWLLQNAPDLNVSIYINGNKVYEGLAETTKDAAKRTVYEDSALLMYDLRIKYFNQKANVLNRKAFSAYKYWKDSPAKYEELYNLFKETLELNGNKIWDNNLIAYFDVIRRYQLEKEAFTNEQILDEFDKIDKILAYKLENNTSDTDKINTIKDQVENMLVAIIDVDCNFIANTLGPKFKANPELNLAKTILRLSVAGKCLSEVDVSVDAAKFIFDNEKEEYGLAKLIASRCYDIEDYQCAEKYYQKAVELASSNEDKADALVSLANLKLKQGSKVAARDYAKKAYGINQSSSAANFIAALYMNSFNDCKKGEDPVKDRAIFIAAYNWYQKAGNSSGMAQAKEQFPSMENVFTWNYEIGQSVSIDCWIGETVTIQRRD